MIQSETSPISSKVVFCLSIIFIIKPNRFVFATLFSFKAYTFCCSSFAFYFTIMVLPRLKSVIDFAQCLRKTVLDSA